ncbi:MAG: ABC transporter permease, partial [Clostridia bacterium]|nr:ABC transporter permease [Clostridia bacterium]
NGTGAECTRTYYSGASGSYYHNPRQWSEVSFRNVLTGEAIKDQLDYGKVLNGLGYADLDKPSAVSIYSSDFDNKDKIIKLLNDFANYKKYDEHGDVIMEGSDLQYSDMIGTMLSAITLIMQAITYVLIAFSSISLVVSSIMIGIITYTSVIERTKEIGVLRSIGARKKDITRVFNSETFIVGAISGLIAVLVTWILTFPANLILKHYTDISGLVTIV